MSDTVTVMREPDGKIRPNKQGKYIFSKSGTYFALNNAQMHEMLHLFDEIMSTRSEEKVS